MATRKEPAPAEVVESSEFTITRFEPGGPIVANFEAVRARIAEMIAIYQGVEVTEEYLAQAKKDRAWLNAFVASAEQKRKDIKARCLAPYLAFEAEFKETLEPVRDVSAAIDTQVKALEERKRAAKRAECVKHYEEYAGALIDVVPFERIEDAKWSLKTTSLMAAFAAIEEIVERIARDDAALDALKLTHHEEAKAEFFATLDMSRAIARSQELDARLEATRRIEAQKAANLEALKPEPVPETALVAEVETALVVEVREWTFTVQCTRAQLDEAIAALRSVGLTGTVK